jgi:PAS domain S-box-containing protein
MNAPNVYQDLVENLPVAALFLVGDQVILNKRARQLSGFQSSDFRSVDEWFLWTFREQAETAKAEYLKAKANNFPHPFRVRFLKKNGEKIITDLTGNLANGMETWLIEDVTESLLIQERYSVLFNKSTDAHFFMDLKGIIDCNEAAVKILNANSREEVLATNPALFSPENQHDGSKSEEKRMDVYKIAMEQGYHRFEWVYKKFTGELFYVQVTLNSVIVAGQRAMLVVWHDLTEIKEAQRKLEEERTHSFHAAKMATLGEMASGIAHEINNPLTVILNRSIQIKNQVRLGEAGIELAATNAEKIITIVNRISKIVRGLRSFARDGGKDSFEFHTIKNILDETMDMCQARFQQNRINLQQNISDPTVLELELYCVPVQIQQVLINLLNNAFDAAIETWPSWIDLNVHADVEHIWISVIDSGEGIPVHLRDKIMQPFFTTKEIGKGTGLGLSISKGIIEAHSGNFYLDETCENTKFVLKLPIVSRADS